MILPKETVQTTGLDGKNFARPEPIWVEGMRCLDLCSDSRQVRSGGTFVAYPGEVRDGRRYIPEALARGAANVLWESDCFEWDEGWSVPHRSVSGLRGRISTLAGQQWGHPSRALRVIGVTGTNGKTTCSHWLAQLLEWQGYSSAVIGTLGNGFPGKLMPTTHTTPDPIQLQEWLARVRGQGAQHCVMEVSSHALAQERVAGVTFRGAIFTNLTRDHLDYHGTLEAYGEAKARLFRAFDLNYALLNLDDPFAKILYAQGGATDRVIGYTRGTARINLAIEQLVASSVHWTLQGVSFELSSPWGKAHIEAPILGDYNLSNLLAVLGAALLEGIPLAALVESTPHLVAPAGRMQGFGGGDHPWVVVDYAHTPDALSQTLETLRSRVARGGKLWVVFGCGGERDEGKRPLMGRVAEQGAERVVLTSDNPRDEDPRHILQQIKKGMEAPAFLIEEDRAKAIQSTLSAARSGDVVLIAGKGHETVQILAQGEAKPFSDVEIVQAWLGDHS
ncbi:MAG: UDP-N-acetylmuramoyl-L-alanyl-D-glutamate--2,6-diaminopimelate ligase [Ferrovum sp.]|jgi:UDP-N-acetylmuramoyl-L-alanyl-D-glutamate--2,6-diaminopimelate ligase|nr:UDP-N-acetylmuramoyl-L-alanyl-D-glutamate--2,6-diaminopimelate ligase [Ferrovum sp.]